MENIHTVAVAIVAFIVLVGVMVVVHEFGHFAVAKFFRVRVESFAVGFGPRLFGIKYGETDYKVCLLPLGGFVKMTGENPGEDQQAEDPGAFTAHPRWQRMLIGLAGPASNFVLALVLMFVYYALINEVALHEVTTTTVEWVMGGSPAAQAGIQPGDHIAAFGSDREPTWERVVERANLSLGQTIPVTVERNGAPVTVALALPPAVKGHDFDFSDIGIAPQFVRGPISVYEVSANSPAAAAGLRAGDEIEAVDGHAFHTLDSMIPYLQERQGQPVTLTISRAGSPLSLTVQPAKMDKAWKLGFGAVPPPVRNDPMPMGKALAASVDFSIDKSMLIFEVLRGMFTHQVQVSQLAGPVGIARMAGQAAEMHGWLPKFGLAAAISINLGILNLLPFPILDGGLIMLLAIEGLLRRDISMAIKERIYQAAFVLIVAFFAFVLFNDVTKLPIFNHIKP
ncbi:MAG: RIP metalloprotease RseP [Terracidiphilus sp.]